MWKPGLNEKKLEKERANGNRSPECVKVPNGEKKSEHIKRNDSRHASSVKSFDRRKRGFGELLSVYMHHDKAGKHEKEGHAGICHQDIRMQGRRRKWDGPSAIMKDDNADCGKKTKGV